MSIVRGSNPVWLMADLVGNLLDDTYYFFVLQNEIPYLPATVWHDPSGTIEWDYPIQFLANGTLPIDIWYDSDVVYRLEVRHGPTQSDPLIYLIENYTPGGTGVNPPDSAASVTDNQISNPQFALFNFPDGYSQTTLADPDPIEFAPGWFLNLTGTGNVSISRESLNDDPATINPTNAPYALRLSLSAGWTDAYISQKFQQNGMLWANTFVASSVTAKTPPTAATTLISADLYDSADNFLATVLTQSLVSPTFTEYPDVGQLGPTINPQSPPSSYIEYRLHLENTTDIYLTSFQLVSTDIELSPNYIQDTVDRQIDHTYHLAYPIVPVGTIIDFGGFGVPEHYLFCDGAAYNRLDFNPLFQAITTTESVTLTSTVATFTVVDGTKYRVGMGLEGTGIPAFTTIIGISTNTITMSLGATTTGVSLVRFYAAAPILNETVSLTSTVSTFTVTDGTRYGINMAVTGIGIPANTHITAIAVNTITISNPASLTTSSLLSFYAVGNGDTTTTFNVYDLRDFVIAGSGGSLFGGGVGSTGGNATDALTNPNQLPSHNHGVPPNTSSFISGGGSPGTLAGTAGGAAWSLATVTGSTGSSAPFSIVQQTAIMRKCIRFE